MQHRDRAIETFGVFEVVGVVVIEEPAVGQQEAGLTRADGIVGAAQFAPEPFADRMWNLYFYAPGDDKVVFWKPLSPAGRDPS